MKCLMKYLSVLLSINIKINNEIFPFGVNRLNKFHLHDGINDFMELIYQRKRIFFFKFFSLYYKISR